MVRLKELNYIEQWGSGIRRIKSSCKARKLKEPEIIEKGDFVDVSLYREVEHVIEAVENTISLIDQEQKNVEFLKQHDGTIRTKKAKEILDVEERRAREILKDLVDKLVIDKKGRGPSTF